MTTNEMKEMYLNMCKEDIDFEYSCMVEKIDQIKDLLSKDIDDAMYIASNLMSMVETIARHHDAINHIMSTRNKFMIMVSLKEDE